MNLDKSKSRVSRLEQYLASHLLYLVVCMVLLKCVGCSSLNQPKASQDTALLRATEQGSNLYNRGDVREATQKYLIALRRAWAIDDAYESGTSAYHLAACYYSMGEIAAAKDWLLDARSELTRANASCRNVWILEAKIARHENRYSDVSYLLNRASEEVSTTNHSDSAYLSQIKNIAKISPVSFHESLRGFRPTAWTKTFWGSTDIPVIMIQASVAAERGNLSEGRKHLKAIEQLLKNSDQSDLLAEWYRISAELYLKERQFLKAAKGFDQEVHCLKSAALYRDLPVALEQCARAYQNAQNVNQAADRLCRAARLYYGRGDYQLAWQVTQQAGTLAESASDTTLRVRLGLIAEQILSELPDDQEADHQESAT